MWRPLSKRILNFSNSSGLDLATKVLLHSVGAKITHAFAILPLQQEPKLQGQIKKNYIQNIDHAFYYYRTLKSKSSSKSSHPLFAKEQQQKNHALQFILQCFVYLVLMTHGIRFPPPAAETYKQLPFLCLSSNDA